METVKQFKRVLNITSRISMNLFGKEFSINTSRDLRGGNRIFVQVYYNAPCTNTGEDQEWKGRKYYLSEFMTDDEIVKTCYVAFEQAVKHEVMEGFKVDGIILFNPHINFEELLKISHKEVKRVEKD